MTSIIPSISPKSESSSPLALKDHILKYQKAVTHCVFDSDVVYKLNSEMRNTITSLKLFKKHEKPDFLQMVGKSYEELLNKFWKCKNAVDGLTDYEWSSEEDQKLQAFAYFAYISRQAYKVRTSSNLTTITEEPNHVHRPTLLTLADLPVSPGLLLLN